MMYGNSRRTGSFPPPGWCQCVSYRLSYICRSIKVSATRRCCARCRHLKWHVPMSSSSMQGVGINKEFHKTFLNRELKAPTMGGLILVSETTVFWFSQWLSFIRFCPPGSELRAWLRLVQNTVETWGVQHYSCMTGGRPVVGQTKHKYKPITLYLKVESLNVCTYLIGN